MKKDKENKIDLATKTQLLKQRRPTKISRIGLNKERYYFIENLSLLFASGLPVLSALDTIKQEVRSKRMRKIIAKVREYIDVGLPLWKALDLVGLFQTYAIALIRVGEESGKLSQNLKVIAEEQEKNRMFYSKVKSAITYPVFVFAAMLIIGFGIAWFILPRLAIVFAQLRVELPLITKIFISIGLFFGNYGNIFFPIFFTVILLLTYLLFISEKTKFIGQSLLFRLPGTGGLVKEIELARMGYLLGTLLDAGLIVTQSLDSLRNATLFPRYKKFYTFLLTQVEEGQSFKKSFDAYPNLSALIPVPVQQLIIAGEQSGSLSKVLLNMGQNFEAKTDITAKNLSVIIEPILLVVVWVGVMAVALSIILPIYGLLGGLNQSL